MATSAASGYLPALGECLDGTKHLTSWKEIYLCLRDESHLQQGGPVDQFLNDPQTFSYFEQIDSPFPTESTDGKSAFDRLASAINAPSSADGSYDIKQIKEDALWLSKEAGIDQVAALRLVVLELQTQPEDTILKDVQTGEADASGSSFQKSALLQSVLGKRPADPLGETYNTTPVRHARLLGLFVSEREFVVKCRELIAYSRLSGAKPGRVWLQGLGKRLVSHWLGREEENFTTFMIQLLEAFENVVLSIQSGSTWFQADETTDQSLSTLWQDSRGNELVHNLSLVLHMVQYRKTAMESEVVKAWYILMNNYGFFNQPEAVGLILTPLQAQPLQSLTALISAGILQPVSSVASISDLAVEAPTEPNSSAPFLRDPSCLEFLTGVLLRAKDDKLFPAGPALLVWSIVLLTVRYMAKLASDHRDTRSEHRAIEISQAADSDNDSVDSFSPQTSRDLRRASFGSDGGQAFTLTESIWDAAQRVSTEEDISDVLFQAAVAPPERGGFAVFDIIAQIATNFCGSYGTAFGGLFGVESRLVLFDVLKVVSANYPYDGEVVASLIAVLSGGETTEIQHALFKQYSRIHPVRRLWEDDKCKRQFFDVARSRFPHEAGPFLALCQCLTSIGTDNPADKASPILEQLRHMTNIATMIQDGNATWELAESDQGNIQLNTDLEIFANILNLSTSDNVRLNRKLLGNQDPVEPFVLYAGTIGQALTDDKPMVVMWNYDYSGLGFLGLLLEVAADLWLSEKAGKLYEGHATIVNETLGLLTSLLEPCDETDATQVLGDFSEKLANSGDVVQVFFDIYESLLYRSVVDQTVAGLLVVCSELVRQLIRVVPGRVWPFMGRSGLLGIDKTDSRLRVVIASSEIPSGRFAFLLSNVYVFEALVFDATTNCLKRKSPSRAVTRFQPTSAGIAGLGITETVEKRILGQFAALLIDVFESSRNWRFHRIQERARITTTLLRTMQKVLVYYNDVDDRNESQNKLVEFLGSAFQHISNSFLINSQNNAACHALFELLNEAVETPLGSLTTNTSRAWLEQSVAALSFASRLVRLRSSLDQSPGVLEAGLLKLVPTLVKMYVLHPEFKLSTIVLLRDLVVAANRLESPPSLLAHLSTDTAKSFLKSLRKFGKPYAEPGLGAAIWKFMSAVVSLRQRWFSIVLLIGSTPRDNLKEKGDDRSAKPLGSILSLAIREASDLTSLDSTYSTTLLEFLSQAADFWPWVAEKLRKDKPTWDALIQYIAALGSGGRRGAVNAHTPQQIEMAAHILDVAAIIVHQNSGVGDHEIAKSLVEKFTYLFERGVSSPEYNSSLHTRLESNFSAHFGKTGCRLINFKRSGKADARLGDDFYYDMDFASKLLSYDGAWEVSGRNGFVDEFRFANRNLSLVEAQIRLFQSWKSLCAEMASVLVEDENFRQQMLRVAGDCIQENLQNTLPLNIFQRLSQSRAELAFTILQSIIPRLKRDEHTEKLLFQAWDLVREASAEISDGLSGDSANYYRTTLRILYLTLQPHVQPPSLHASRQQYSGTKNKPLGIDVALLEIIRNVVAQGFESLVTLLHDDPSKVQPSDFALLQAMLHTMLQSPDLERHHEALLNIFSDARSAMYAATLFSWADRLLVDGDPIYGEISINLLLELSTIVPIAEAIVTSGSLGQIATSNLARVYQKGAGQFDQPSRLYSIWTKGILPLAVNLLAAIGPLIGSDTASFINQFSGQLTKASACLDSAFSHSNGTSAGLVTLSMAGEANMLALISSSLLAFKDAGASAGVIAAEIPDLTWNRMQVKRDIEDRLSRRSALRDSIVPTDEREEQWLRQKATDGTHKAENLLEHKVVELLTGALEMLGPAEV